MSQEKLAELDADKRIWWGPEGKGVPALKRFLSEVRGRVPQTLWFYEEVGHTQDAKREVLAFCQPGQEPFATPKPEKLLQRIVEIGSQPGDIVLDCFVGSGTTAAVAQKMGRRWIAIERERATIDTFTFPRLRAITGGSDPGGITGAVGWQGGGGFRILDVAPSMFEEDGGQIFLSEWATNGRLAEVTAAQLHYDYAYDPPFCGRRGRSRLAVIDGLVNEYVIQLLVTALSESDSLVVCGTAIDPTARDVLRESRPGSSVRKIPQSVLQEYRQPTHWAQPRWIQHSLFEVKPDGVDAEQPEAVKP